MGIGEEKMGIERTGIGVGRIGICGYRVERVFIIYILHTGRKCREDGNGNTVV